MAFRDAYIDEDTYLAVREAARRAYRRAAEMVAPKIEQALVAAAGQSISDAEWFALTEEVSDAYGDAYLDAVINAGAELGVMPSDDDLLAILAEQEAAIEGFASQMRALIDLFQDDMLRQQVPVDQIRDRLFEAGQSPLNPRKADMFARTATNTAVNAGFESQFRAAGLAAKSWITQRDDRVRESHEAVDRDVVQAGETFMVGGFEARFPGDPRLPIGLRINCRCILGWVDGNGVRRALTAKRSELYSVARQLEIPGRSRMNKAQLQTSVIREMCLQGLAAGTDCTNRFDEMNMASLLSFGRLGNIRGRYRMRKAQLIAALIEEFQAVATVGLAADTTSLALEDPDELAAVGVDLALDVYRFAFDPTQPRDERGRWVSSGSVGSTPERLVEGPTREQVERYRDMYGQGIESVFPEGSFSVTTVPFPSASRRKGQRLFDRRAVASKLSQPVELSKFDPRTLHASQSGVTRDGVAYYLTPEYATTGRTYADMEKPGNRFPVIYRQPSGQLVILSGHHRAVAALVQGRPLDGILVESP